MGKLGAADTVPSSPVDLIVRARDNHALTDQCLGSIARWTPREQYRLILVDDGSVDPQRHDLVDFYVRSEQGRGAVTATNLGLQIAVALPGDLVVVMDNDTEIPEGDTLWLERMVQEFQWEPRTAALGAVSSRVAGRQQALSVPQTYTADWADEKRKTGGTKQNPEVATFVSFCVMLKKSIVRELGLWDERFNPGNWEDTDYALRIRAAGYEVRVARSVWVHHRAHATFGDELPRLLKLNQEKFAEKWGMGRLWDMGLVGDRDIAILAGRQAGIVREG
jgi:GT2 family glycosyltransferase